MKKRMIILGCGLVGQTLARDLAADEGLEVAAADICRENLGCLAEVQNLTTIQADLSTPDAVKAVVKDFDVVVGAMPSTLGFQTLQAVIESGKSFSDISFMAEDPMSFDQLAKNRGVTVVFDCGVAPGLANMVIGHCAVQLDETLDVLYYVGGLPKHPQWPYQYKAPFAPADVIEEYTRPARLIENDCQVVRPALSDAELIDFPPVGTLEAFNTDGLRSLLRTVKATNMREKTLRYPGHCELMRVFRETGLFSREEIAIGGRKIRPLDVTSKLLFSKWRLEPGEEECTLLRVIVEGRKNGRQMRYTYDLYDEYDAATGQRSMARTTAFPNAIMARWIARGEFNRPGVFPPEMVCVEAGMMDRMIRELSERRVNLHGGVEESHHG